MSYDLIFPFCDLKNFFSLKIIIKKKCVDSNFMGHHPNTTSDSWLYLTEFKKF